MNDMRRRNMLLYLPKIKIATPFEGKGTLEECE